MRWKENVDQYICPAVGVRLGKQVYLFMVCLTAVSTSVYSTEWQIGGVFLAHIIIGKTLLLICKITGLPISLAV
jgi:hypothetical protein